MAFDPHDMFGRAERPDEPPPPRKGPPPKRTKDQAFAKLKMLEGLMSRLVERPPDIDSEDYNALRNVERAMSISAQLVDMPIESARRGVEVLRSAVGKALAKPQPDDVNDEDWRLFQQFGDSMRSDIGLVLILAEAVERIQALMEKKREQYPELALTFEALAGDLPEGATMKSFVISPGAAMRGERGEREVRNIKIPGGGKEPSQPEIEIDDECPCPECRAEREKNAGGHGEDDDPPIIRF